MVWVFLFDKVLFEFFDFLVKSQTSSEKYGIMAMMVSVSTLWSPHLQHKNY